MAHHLAAMACLGARFRLVLAVGLATGACAGGCSTVNRSVQSSSISRSSELTASRTVRAQSGEPAASSGVAGSAATESRAPAAVLTEGPAVGPLNGALEPPPRGSPAPPVVTGPLDTVLESLFGEASTSDWAPLLLSELFTEGWNRPFVFSPPSDSGALRQEWINSANGVFYRQWVLDYNFRDHVGPSENRDIGTWSIFAPLSRRLELFISIPFVDYHRVADPVAPIGPASPLNRLSAAAPTSSYKATFGDISFTPQVLLHETQNTSIMSVLTIRAPTGSTAAGNGDTSLGPQIQFWQGLPNRWVIRGGAGPTIPLTPTGLRTTLDTNLTIGRFLTLDEVRYFKEFTIWLALNNSATTDNRGPGGDTLTVLPGIRFRIAQNTWFLYGVEVPLVAPKNEDFGMYFRLVRRW
jgi:Putative MetA-pathway of phenol degradation